MDSVYHLIAVQHPGTLLVLGASGGLMFAGLFWAAARIIEYRRWASEAPQRELSVLASGLSSVGRQGRLPLPSPTVGSHLVGSTPRAASPLPPLGDPPPASPPYSSLESYRDADGFLCVGDLDPCDADALFAPLEHDSYRSAS